MRRRSSRLLNFAPASLQLGFNFVAFLLNNAVLFHHFIQFCIAFEQKLLFALNLCHVALQDTIVAMFFANNLV